MYYRYLALALLALSVLSSASEAKIAPAHLRCESRVDPIGLTEPKPQLSWVDESADRGETQTAWQVMVASSAQLLKNDQADVWDSGKVSGADTYNIAWGGPALRTNHAYFWKVRVWDKAGQVSGWSASAHWSMGLLDASDWQAEWIGDGALRQPELNTTGSTFWAGAKWIGFADDAAGAPKGERYFKREFDVPEAGARAELYLAADDHAVVKWNGETIATPRDGEDSARIFHHSLPAVPAGKNILEVTDINSAQGPAGIIALVQVIAADGKVQRLVSDGTWQARGSSDGAWSSAHELGDYGSAPWGQLANLDQLYLPPALLLRKSFDLTKPVKRAIIYTTAQGLCDVSINGQPVSSDLLSPGWTNYNKRIHVRAYDVTHLLKKGANAVGAEIADGWFCGYVGLGGKRDYYGSEPRFLGQIMIEYEDGESTVLASDHSWKAAVSPTRHADLLKGEAYDARAEQKNWCQPDFDDHAWQPVTVAKNVGARLENHPGEPVRVIHEFIPKSIKEPKPHVYVFDLGQNFAGVARLRVKGDKGQRIVLRFAERLNADGTIYTENLRYATATDEYICKGGGEETWQPRFTYHGFQYVEVTGLSSKPDARTITGLAYSSDTARVGSFASSNGMLNQLYNNIYWTQRMNFIDIPTDCPQRDERLGWTGDAQVYVRAATLNTDVQAFFRKWLVDLEDEQLPDGEYPCTAPLRFFGGGGAAWADAGIICPWTIYKVYGDTRLIERRYPAMVKYVEHRRSMVSPELVVPADAPCIGDWLNIQADTPKDLLFHAYFAHSADLLAQMAAALGRTDDAKKYGELFQGLKASFARSFVREDGTIKGDTQCAYALAISFNLLDSENEKKAAKHLVKLIEDRAWHLSTGFLGTKELMLALQKIGRDDVAYRLILNDTFPSWGFTIKNGATSIWERWDGWTPDKGFQDASMNSFAHYSFGAVYQWMVENIGGIQNSGTAYDQILVRPSLGGGLQWAKVEYDSVRGRIRSDWKRVGDRLTLNLQLPVNASALVYVPAQRSEDVEESGRSALHASGIEFVKIEDGCAVFRVGSGAYTFTSKVGPLSAMAGAAAVGVMNPPSATAPRRL